MTHRHLTLVPASLILLSLSGCGDDDAGQTGGTEPTGESTDTDDADATLETTLETSVTDTDTDTDPSSTSGTETSTDPTVTSADTTGDETTAADESSTTDESGSESSSSTDDGSSTTDAESSSTGTPADDDTIYEIQDGTIAEDVDVDVRGVIVTAVTDNAIFVQEPGGGEYSGVYVYLDNPPTVEIGDSCDILGVTQEFNGLTEINASAGSVVATGSGLDLAPELIDAADVGEPWESVLVRIEGAPLAVTSIPFADEFIVDAGGTDVRIDDLVYRPADAPDTFPDFGVGAEFTAIQGPLNFFGGNFKIVPRAADDLEGYVAPEVPEFGVDDLLPGDLVVTEVMANPTCPQDDCEWIEVYNATGVELDLQGLRIQDDQMDEGIVTASVVVAAGGYVVIASHDVTTWPYAFEADGYFGEEGPALGNGGDAVFLLNAREVLDGIAAWEDAPAGRAWRLDPSFTDAVANDDVDNWCFSDTPLVDANVMGEFATPAAANGVACLP